MTKWHYTVGQNLPSIMESGVLRLATIGVRPGVKPAVWFSSNPLWENTCNKMMEHEIIGLVQLTKEQTHAMGNRLIRIGVAGDAAPHDWKAYKRLSGEPGEVARALYNTAIEQGSRPGQWFCSFEPVPQAKWLGVEMWDGSQWLPYDADAHGAMVEQLPDEVECSRQQAMPIVPWIEPNE